VVLKLSGLNINKRKAATGKGREILCVNKPYKPKLPPR